MYFYVSAPAHVFHVFQFSFLVIATRLRCELVAEHGGLLHFPLPYRVWRVHMMPDLSNRRALTSSMLGLHDVRLHEVQLAVHAVQPIYMKGTVFCAMANGEMYYRNGPLRHQWHCTGMAEILPTWPSLSRFSSAFAAV